MQVSLNIDYFFSVLLVRCAVSVTSKKKNEFKMPTTNTPSNVWALNQKEIIVHIKNDCMQIFVINFHLLRFILNVTNFESSKKKLKEKCKQMSVQLGACIYQINAEWFAFSILELHLITGWKINTNRKHVNTALDDIIFIVRSKWL